MRASAPRASTISASLTRPRTVAVGYGTIWAAGNTSRSHVSLGNVYSGPPPTSSVNVSSHAGPRSTPSSTSTSPAANQPLSPGAAGPKRVVLGAAPDAGNVDSHPCAYGSAASSLGATTSWCNQYPSPVAASVNVAYQTSSRWRCP